MTYKVKHAAAIFFWPIFYRPGGWNGPLGPPGSATGGGVGGFCISETDPETSEGTGGRET